MKRTILWLSVLLAMAGTAPASAAFLGANPRLGESLLNTGIEQVAGDVSRERLPGSSGAWLRWASKFFVAPATAATAEEAASGASLRLQYMGRTPGKLSRTGLEVQARAQAEGSLVRVGDMTMVRYYDPASSRYCWTDIANTDMAHRVDAVSWWNSVGVKYGPKAPEVRAFMLAPKNYELQPYWINRSKGALLTERYQQF